MSPIRPGEENSEIAHILNADLPRIATALERIADELRTANIAQVAESLAEGARRAEADGLDDAETYAEANRIGQQVLDRLGLT